MGAAGPTKRGGSIADINVTPLVDVVLVLLIIFMVVGDLLAEETPESSIPIDLPPAATGDVQPSNEKNSFAVAVDKNGKFIVAGKRLNEEQLAKRVRQEVAVRGDDMEVTVASDKDARHESFVRLLDILRDAEIYRFAIQTNLAEDED
jgi:biopolymer transport protein ExbD